MACSAGLFGASLKIVEGQFLGARNTLSARIFFCRIVGLRAGEEQTARNPLWPLPLSGCVGRLAPAAFMPCSSILFLWKTMLDSGLAINNLLPVNNYEEDDRRGLSYFG